MTCDDFRGAALAPSLDGEARAHADGCQACRGFVDTVVRNERLLGAVTRPALPAGLWERLERRLPPPRRPASLGAWVGFAAAAALLVAAVATALRRPEAPSRRLSVVVLEAPAPPEDADREDLADYAALAGGPEMQYLDAGGDD